MGRCAQEVLPLDGTVRRDAVCDQCRTRMWPLPTLTAAEHWATNHECEQA